MCPPIIVLATALSCIEGYLINVYKFPLSNFHLYKTFQTGSAYKPGTHKQPLNHAILTWILADVILAPTLTSSGCFARVGMLGALPLTAKP